MAGRRPPEAIRNFVAPLQRAVSYVTRGVLRPAGNPLKEVQLLTFKDDPVKMNGVPLWLSIRQWFRVVQASVPRGRWKVSTVTYYYELQDSAHHEIISYPWHPIGPSEVTHPHIHLGDGPLQKAHIPTGRVALEDVLRLAIEGLGVPPSGLSRRY